MRTHGLRRALQERVPEETKMTTKTPKVPADEPLGIIISRGSRDEPTPIFSTYIWGPEPEPVSDASKAA